MMKKNIIFIVTFLFFCFKSFAQDSLIAHKGWQLEGGVNMLIPVRQYNEEFGFDCFDCILGEFKVKPLFTATNLYVDMHYCGIIYECGKSYLGTKIALGYKHQERKNIKKGYYGGIANYFEGEIENYLKENFLSFGFGLNYNFKTSKRIIIENQIFLSFNTLFSQYEKHIETNYFTNNTYTWNNTSSGIDATYLTLNYEFRTKILLNKKIIVYPRIEVPLILINDILWKNWSNEENRLGPYSDTPYFISINNIAFLNFGIGIIYNIKSWE